MARSVKVAVIGAGVSGLAAARELQREGHRVVIFEKNDCIGGTWVYDPKTESDPLGIDPNREIVHSSLYLSLRTNLPRQLMSFLDYPFAKHDSSDPRTFPGHEEVLHFLNKFAADFGLQGLIRFNTDVVRVELVEEGQNQWVVESKTQESEPLTREVFEAVVVCSGHYTEPRLADIPGTEKWPGYQLHSHNYRVPEPFQGQIVVLIGLGPSSFDISREIGAVAKEVHIAARNTDLMGIRLDNRHNIKQHSTIKSVHEDGLVAFEDGFSVYADTIIHCTGYKCQFPFLETKGIVTIIEDKCVGPLYKHVFPPALAPWLSFIGLTYLDSIFPIIELQSKWVAKVLSGKLLLPTEEEMMNSVQQLYEQMEANRIPKSHTHCLRPLQVDYKNWLAAQLGLPPLEEWRENMLAECIKKVVENYDNYRDQWDDAYWDAITGSASAS